MLIINGVISEKQIETEQKTAKTVLFAFLLISSIAFALFGFVSFIQMSDFARNLPLDPEVNFGVVQSSESAVVPVDTNVGTVESPFEELLVPLYYSPERLIIETLGIESEIIPVTVEEGGYLETPKDWMEVGWFKRSTLAGDWGNLLLNGHYDNNNGGPAAFWQLKNISVGDRVVVEDRLGRTFSYAVLEKYYIEINDPDRTKVFSSDNNKKEITLITCGGVWLPGQGTYNQRLIVRGELETETE